MGVYQFLGNHLVGFLTVYEYYTCQGTVGVRSKSLNPRVADFTTISDTYQKVNNAVVTARRTKSRSSEGNYVGKVIPRWDISGDL